MTLFTLIDFLAVCVGSLVGSTQAVQDPDHQYDIVGCIGLGIIVALGGGLTRDVLLGQGPPLALLDPWYLCLAILGALVGLCFNSMNIRVRHLLDVIQALALGLYAVAGSIRAQQFGLSIPATLFLGVVMAVGGGAWRDIICNRPPRIFQPSRPNVLAALGAAITYLTLVKLNFSPPWAISVGCVTGFTLRICGLCFNWQTRPITIMER